MRRKADNPPPGAYVVEPMPGHPGMLRVRFFEHAEQITERTHWEYDEYDLVVPERDGIAAEVMVSYDTMLEQAKAVDEDFNAENREIV